MAQTLAQEGFHTESDYYNLPEDVRAELIDGRIYYQAAPNRIHQEILNYLNTEINIYIRKLNLYADAGVREYWIVDPRIKKVFVYYFEQADFQIGTYTFNDRIKANIYDDLWIDFRELEL